VSPESATGVSRDATLPAPVARIAAEAVRYSAGEALRGCTRELWEREVALARSQVPGVVVRDVGGTVRIGELSPGCVACKSGTWDCVFVTMRCNLSCPFCLAPDSGPPMRPHGAFGDIEESVAGYHETGVTGVSFSGGEPFLEPDVVLRWLETLRAALPGVYLWAYTNGTLLTSGLLERLAEAGLDELRFDLAATGYRDAAVLRALGEAVRLLPAVAVEVPAIPADREALLGSLGLWAELGVRYLNLHELVYEPGSPSGRMTGERAVRMMPDGHRCEVDPGSAGLVREVLSRVSAEGLPLGVNDCSLRSKALQLRGRRRMLAPFTMRPHERLCGEGVAESAIVFDDRVVRAVSLAERPTALENRGDSWRAARARRLLPLEVGGAGQWVGFEPLGAEEPHR